MVSNKLLSKHFNRLLGRAMNILKDSHTSEDVVITALSRFENKISNAPEMTEEQQLAWLLVVVKNLSLKALTKAKRFVVTDPSNFSDEVDEGLSPLEQIEAAEQHEEMLKKLRNALKRLPQRQQNLLHLQYMEGLTYKQISERTGLTIGNIGFLINKSMNTLRQYI